MADISKLRQHALALEARLRVLHQTDTGELRQLTPDQQREFDTVAADLAATRDSIDKHAVILELAKNPGNVVHPNGAPSVILKSSGRPWQVRDQRDGDEVRGRAVDALERLGVEDAAIERCANVMEAQSTAPQEQNELARRIAVCSSPDYASAFARMARDPITGHSQWTSKERAAWDAMLEARAALSIGTTSTGQALVPTHLDPTVILTNNGSSNVMRQIARTVTISEGSAWHGVASQGVTASYDPESQEVSDDSPTFVQPTIPIVMARALVRGSIEAFDDLANIEAEVGRMFADAKDRLEEASFSTGNGITAPHGVWHALNATTSIQVVSTTAATIGLVDIDRLYKAVPARYRRRSSWLANPLYTLAVKDLGTALSASYSGDLRDPAASAWLGRPVYESDDAPSTQTTTALDNEVILGDFSRYVIADRIGASVEFIPHLFSTANNLPSGERAMFFRWRNGADVVDSNAFRLLVDKTSA